MPLSFFYGFYSEFLKDGYFPQPWVSRLHPIFKKKGSPHDPKNYRPISILCATAKFFEKIVDLAMKNELTRLNISAPNQYGFTPGKSTVGNLIDTYEFVSQNVHNGIPVDVIYLDLEKAFDRVKHEILAAKLVDLGVNPLLVLWISEYLRERKHYTRIRGQCSEILEVKSCVPQGSLLSPVV